MIVKRFHEHWLKFLLVFSLCAAFFAYGFAARAYQIFPYSTIRDATAASQVLIEAALPPAPILQESHKDNVLAPTVRNHGNVAGPELILLSGGRDFLKNQNPDGCVAWLMDRSGKIRHVWKYDRTIGEGLQYITHVPGISGDFFPVGIHLYDNGDLLVNFQGNGTYPFAMGMARYDKHSRLLWKKELLSHHWFTVAEDGRIFVPALHVVPSPVVIGDSGRSVISYEGKVYKDVIMVLDGDGNVLDEIPMLEALVASGRTGLITQGEDLITDDPLHLNFVQQVGTEVAKWQPWLSPDDLLVSFRNLNTVGILDWQTRRFKWLSTGATIKQHCPQFFDHGLLVLDNLGGAAATGWTQLVKIDFSQGIPARVFPRQGVDIPDACSTMNSGHLDVHRDGKRVLFAMTRQGLIWEVDTETGEVDWEYIYVHPNENGVRQPINTAKYVYQASFLSSEK